MNGLVEFLREETKPKLHSSHVARMMGIDNTEIKSLLLEISTNDLIDGMEFEYLTGWIYFTDNEPIPSELYQVEQFGKRVLFIGIILTFAIPLIGLVVAVTGFYIWIRAFIQIKTADGRKIDIVGAGVIMNALRF